MLSSAHTTHRFGRSGRHSRSDVRAGPAELKSRCRALHRLLRTAYVGEAADRLKRQYDADKMLLTSETNIMRYESRR